MKYYCKDCKKEIVYRSERCVQCSLKHRRSYKNEYNPNYKQGLYSNKKLICKQCKKILTVKKSKHNLCINCFNELRKKDTHPLWKGGKPKCIDCGTLLSTRGTRYYRPKRCRNCYENNGGYVKHHVDLNQQNNKNNNLLYVSPKIHVYLHRKAYEYMLEIGLIKKYLVWFNKKYGLNRRIR